MILALTLGLCLSVADLQSEPWYYADFARLKREGILLGYPDQVNPRQDRPARLELARITLSCYDQWLAYLGQVDGQRIAVATAKETSESIRWTLDVLKGMKGASLSIDSLHRLIVEFAPEIRAQYPQRSPTSMTKRLARSQLEIDRLVIPTVGQARQRFHDVPQDHWASGAVHNLRREGVIWGYPSGRFNGGK
ncbi:MAG: S-layer homology domain-containing protein [Fimbriimonas sp.]